MTTVQRNKSIVNNENIEIPILANFAAYPKMSARQAALESGLPKSSVQRILRKHKFFFEQYHLNRRS